MISGGLQASTDETVSVRAVIRRDNLILVEQPETLAFCYLPGGRIEEGEDLKGCLERELREELKGANFEIGPYLGRVQHIFQNDAALNKSVNHFFEVIIVDGDPVHREPGRVIRWLPLSSSELSEIKPPILKKILLGFEPDVWDYIDAEI